MTPYKILENFFGYTEFREGQLDIINSILGGRNVLAVLPTGAGKSICYQIPALNADGYSIVISPLIALMKDQVDSLNKNQLIASYINSTLDYSEEQKVLNNLRSGEIKLLYVAPEKLESVKFIEQLKSVKPKFVFVDEAHCISEWGVDFRPSYRKIKEIASLLEVKNISAFTATATPDVRKDILAQLGMEEPEIFVSGFERNNISLNVIRTEKKKEFVFKLLNEHGSPAIVYASTRRAAESVYKFLNAGSFKASYYHAGLNSELRRLVQDDFINGRTDVICATNAFGMGIDKSDIRLIIHYNVPGSIENYYQEIGRAGRDGKDSHAYLLYDEKDVKIQDYFIETSVPSTQEVITIYNLLYDYTSTALGQLAENAIPFDSGLKDYYTLKGISASIFNSSLKVLRDSGLLELTTNTNFKPEVRSLLSPAELKKFIQRIAPANQKNLLLAMIKIYGSALFSGKIKMSADAVSRKADLPVNILMELLETLNNAGIVDMRVPSALHNIKLLTTRSDTRYIELNFSNIRKFHDHSKEKLLSVIDFVFNDGCRFDYILNYFGEKRKDYNCGKCDNCGDLVHESNTNEFIAQAALRTLHENRMNLRKSRLIKILQGKSKTTEEKKLSTFGVCRHYSDEEIKNTISYLGGKGLIHNYDNILSLTETAKEQFTDTLKLEEAPDYDRRLQLFNRLRNVRKTIAVRFSQTERLICSDTVLRNISEKEPSSPAQLMAIEGVSKNLFFKAGNEIIEEVKEFQRELESIKKSSGLPDNLVSIRELIDKKYKLEEIASITKLPETIVSVQIESLIMLNPETPIDKLIDKPTRRMIEEKIETGLEELKELKKALPSNIGYPKIRIVLAKVYSRERND